MRNAAERLTRAVFAPMPRAMEQMTAPADFEMALADRARNVEQCLQVLLTTKPREGEIARPEELMQAIRHGVLGGG